MLLTAGKSTVPIASGTAYFGFAPGANPGIKMDRIRLTSWRNLKMEGIVVFHYWTPIGSSQCYIRD